MSAEQITFTSPEQGCWVDLEPWEYTHGCDVGIQRMAANWRRPDAAHYDKRRMQDDRTAQVASALAELAVAKRFNQYWSGHVWHPSEHNRYKGLPDVGRRIEVRHVRSPFHPAAVRRYQVGQRLMLVVAYPEPPEFKRVLIAGFRIYDEAWADGKPAPYDPAGTRLIAWDQLLTEGL